MRIELVYYDKKISWNKKWVFLGSSFQNLQYAEKNIKGERIKINKLLHEIYNEELSNYLNWTEKQRVNYSDHINWWMTDLAGRNNLDSNFFLYICQIKLLKKILNNIKESTILIVSDDILLMQAIKKNLSNHQIKTETNLLFKISKNLITHYLKFIRNSIIGLIDIIFTLICSKITLKEKKFPVGDVYLLHQYVETNSLKNHKVLKTRYFPNLKEHFLKKNINLYCLHWSGLFWSGKLKAFKKIRADNAFIPEDWLKIHDYFISIKNFFKTSAYFKDKTQYPDLDIEKLLLSEKRNYLEKISSNLRFWTYIPAIKRWSKNCNSITCVDHYENMTYEHALIAAVKELKIKTQVLGYHHTLCSKEFTAWHSLNSEWKSKYKPDYVISLGPISTQFLKNQGVPSERIIDGPALRYTNILSKNYINNKNKKNILVPLSQNSDASYEVLKGIKTLSQELEQTDYFFIIKPHPNLEITKHLLLLGLDKLPKNITISNDDIDKLLNDCLFTIFMSTAAAYNAVINANIVLNLSSELSLSDNYLDIFKKEFKFINSYSLDSIKTTLIEFTKDEKKIERYEDEFGRLKKYLIDGMNTVNEVNLDKFIRN